MDDFVKVYGSGFRHGQVRTAEGDVYDIDAIINIESTPTQETTEIPGDDEIKATFAGNRKDELTISANGISMDVLQAITGNGLSSSAGGSEIAMGTDTELNPPYVELSGEIVGKTDQGTEVTIRRVWHKVQINSVTVNGGNGSEMSVEMAGSAYRTEEDIVGDALASKRVWTGYIIDES